MPKIFVTGDTHADWSRFSTNCFPEQKEMTRDDYVIVCGDFGIWHPDNTEKWWFKWLSEKNFTILFVDGNHENFDRLYSDEFEIVDFYGGKTHRICENVYHLMRGYVFELCGKKFFAFGGASSHDIQDGILEPSDYKSAKELANDYNKRTQRGEMLRINHMSWWEREMPSREEMDNGINNLNRFKEIDYVLSHSLPSHILPSIGMQAESNSLTNYFQNEVVPILKRKENPVKWYSGHYHLENEVIYEDNITYIVKYHDIERIV